jgi:SSS family solute:Na+ symporter
MASSPVARASWSGLPEGIQPDRVFPFYIMKNLPAGICGLLVASVFAAGMSTISTSVNSSATVILNDYFRKSVTKKSSERSRMKILYISTAIFSALGILIAIAMINVQSVLDAWWKLASVFSGGMLGLFLLGYFSKKVTSKAALTGVLAGVPVIAWMSLSQFLPGRFASPFHSYLTIVFGTTVIFIIGFLAGVIFKPQKSISTTVIPDPPSSTCSS